MTDTQENPIDSPAAPLVKKPVGKVGDAGQPSIKAWDEEIKSDLMVALGKIKNSPSSAYTRLARIIQANLG